MNLKENESAYVARLESLMFDSKLESGTPSQKADVLRNIIVHLNCAPYQKIVCEETSNRFAETYEKKYAEIVDCFDETTGLNNFAAGALALCAGKKNESQSWTSSLNMDVLNDLPGFQEFKKDCKVKEELFARTKENSMPLFRPRTKKLVVKNKPETPKDELPSYFSGAKSLMRENNPTTSNSVPSINSAPPMPQNATFQNTSKVPYSQSGNNPNEKQGNLHAYGSNKLTSNRALDDQQSGSSNDSSRYPQRKSLFSSGKSNNFNYPSGKSYQKKSDWRKRQREEDDDEEDNTNDRFATGPFKTAKEQLIIDQQKKNGNRGRGQAQNYNQGQVSTSLYGAAKKSLGTRRGPSSKFVPPVINKDDEGDMMIPDTKQQGDGNNEEPVDERLKGIDPKMIELITNEIMDHGPKLHWDDVAGLDFAKKTIKEIVVWPMLRPDIFTGLRGPPKGLLLFGPPGTGKTLIGKCIASQSKSTFFCISASSLTSKWVGEGEKMVRALFAVARCNQPAVVFIDEIDSLLSQRSDNEHEASRRIKTEFLVQLDGAATDSEDRILIIGATNRPQEIDEAARRRLVKRLYIPLPESIARRQIVINLMSQQKHQLSDADLDLICEKTEGYSGSDMANVCREAALGPIRSIPFDQIETITNDEVRAIKIDDFMESLMQVRASVSSKDLDLYIEWNKLYGSFGK